MIRQPAILKNVKYQLETIPVYDAWASDATCPLCTLMDAAEHRHVNYYLGNSVMNPETRVLVNETGFCSRHFPMMREAGYAHHLGLVETDYTLTLDGGCGFGGALMAACLTPSGELVDRVEA